MPWGVQAGSPTTWIVSSTRASSVNPSNVISMAAIALSNDRDRLERPEGLTARAAFAGLAHVCFLTESRATSFDERRLALS